MKHKWKAFGFTSKWYGNVTPIIEWSFTWDLPDLGRITWTEK